MAILSEPKFIKEKGGRFYFFAEPDLLYIAIFLLGFVLLGIYTYTHLYLFGIAGVLALVILFLGRLFRELTVIDISENVLIIQKGFWRWLKREIIPLDEIKTITLKRVLESGSGSSSRSEYEVWYIYANSARKDIKLFACLDEARAYRVAERISEAVGKKLIDKTGHIIYELESLLGKTDIETKEKISTSIPTFQRKITLLSPNFLEIRGDLKDINLSPLIVSPFFLGVGIFGLFYLTKIAA